MAWWLVTEQDLSVDDKWSSISQVIRFHAENCCWYSHE